MVAPFGTSLHVSGRDGAALERAIAPLRQRTDLEWKLRGHHWKTSSSISWARPGTISNECHCDHGGTAAWSSHFGDFWRRTSAMVLKEFLQLRRDRITFATMITIPLLQLVLFGYAINTTPRDLPTAVLLQESGDVVGPFSRRTEHKIFQSDAAIA